MFCRSPKGIDKTVYPLTLNNEVSIKIHIA